MPTDYESNNKKLHISLASTRSCSSSSVLTTSNASLDSQRKLVDASSNSTLKKCDSPNSGVVINANSQTLDRKYSVNMNNEDLEKLLEATKQILIEYRMPVNRRIIKDLRNYIINYGSIVSNFSTVLKTEFNHHMYILRASQKVMLFANKQKK